MLESLDRWLTILVLRIVPLWCTPNQITLTRFFSIPLIFVLYFAVSPWAGTAVFVLVAITDFIDGRLVRGRNMVSYWGRFLDIGCDLTLVWSGVGILWLDDIIQFRIDSILAWLLLLMLVREIIVFASKSYYRVRPSDVRVFKSGKCKTAFFMMGLTVLLLSTVTTYGTLIGATLVAGAAGCSLLSGIKYVRLFR